MDKPRPAALLWSGGKDSALALHHARDGRHGALVVKLVTCVSQAYDRVSMHGVRRQLVEILLGQLVVVRNTAHILVQPAAIHHVAGPGHEQANGGEKREGEITGAYSMRKASSGSTVGSSL